MPSTLTLKAPAKINPFLNLLQPRDDGFHAVRFVMQTVALSDTLTLTPLERGHRIDFTCSDPTLSSPENLVVKAYTLFYQSTGIPPWAVSAHLEKHIPVQAGLGGGSSDAAAMLRGLNTLHEEAVAPEALVTIAATLGSDVAFFLTGGSALATGRGEIITPLPPLPEKAIVLLKPLGYGISTAEAYQRVRQHNAYRPADFSQWQTALDTGTWSDFGWEHHLFNDFEAALFDTYPDLTQAQQTLRDLGATGTLLSGSGPTLFAILPDAANQYPCVQRSFPGSQWFCELTHTC